MKWVIRRLLVIWLMMSIFCAAVVVLGRLDHTPSELQALGFDVCDGEPCFRGIKVGTDWTKVQRLFPNGVLDKGYLQIALNMVITHDIVIHQSRDHRTVDAIAVTTNAAGEAFSFSAADVIAQYGAPCRAYVEYTDSIPGVMIMIYPKMMTRIDMNDDDYDYRLRLNSPTWDFAIIAEGDNIGTCNDPTSEDFGPWRGFTSAVEYRRLNLLDLGAVEPTPENP
jgi:hypothetical protein